MLLTALHHVGPLLDLTTTAKRMSVATVSDAPETNDTFEQSLTAIPSEPGSSPDVPFAAAGTVHVASQAAVGSTRPQQQSTPAQDASQNPASTAADSLMSTVKGYTSASQDSSQAYQEYAKAWGGRVVHGQVELPPLSIYLE